MRVFGRVLLVLVVALALLSFGMAAVGVAYHPNVQIASGFDGRHVSVGGVPIRIVQRGKGPDVLLIHGSPGSVEDWLPIMARLDGEFRLTAYDRPGHGFSGDLGGYSPADNAKIALGVIDALGLDRVTVAGHSYGGATALAMAIGAPPRVASYVIVDSAAYKPSREPDPLYSILALPAVGMGFASALGPTLAPDRIREGLTQQFRGSPPPGFVLQRMLIWATPKVTHAIALEALGASDALAAQSPRYGQIHAPVHILGQADDPFRVETAERLHREVPGSTLQLLSGAGHYLQFEKADEVANTIRAAAKQN